MAEQPVEELSCFENYVDYGGSPEDMGAAREVADG